MNDKQAEWGMLRGCVSRMTHEDQMAFWKHIAKALHWHGWDKRNPNHASSEIDAIAKLLFNNKLEMAEYT